MPNQSGVWTLSQQFQARGQGLWPAPPGAPTIGTATAGSALCASVTFTAPACTGYPAGITSYTVTSTPGCLTKTGASSPLVVTGLTNGTSYTFKVKATGTSGLTSLCSAASNSITASNAGQQAYTTAGTYSWVAPAGVTKVSVVAVGGGGRGGTYKSTFGGAGGGGLGYKNNISVTPGNSYTVVVGAGTIACKGRHGGDSYFCSTSVVKGGGAYATGTCGIGFGGTYTGDGGGNGGRSIYYGGGGAGGYAGNGGQAGSGSSGPCASQAGSGGGGGGAATGNCNGNYGGGGGGGVGILGQGSNGAAGKENGASGGLGGAGSNGGTGDCGYGAFICCVGNFAKAGFGGAYGGGGGASKLATGCTNGAVGGVGAVRIIWPGCSRKFPSTCTGNK